MGAKGKDEPTEPPGWTPYIRALCITAFAALAVTDIRTPGDPIPWFVYSGIVGLGLGIEPAYFKKAATAALKALSDG